MNLPENERKTLIGAPMSNTLISKYFDGHANIKSLEDISQMRTLGEVFNGGQFNHVVIFIAVSAPSNGHWVCMFINGQSLYYFDSYGDYPLQILDELAKDGKNLWRQDKNLLHLIRASKFKDTFFYNAYQYQEDGASIQTCGRFTTLTLVLNSIYVRQGRKFDLEMLNKIMTYWKNKFNKSYGEIAVYFVNEL